VPEVITLIEYGTQAGWRQTENWSIVIAGFAVSAGYTPDNPALPE
jgi:hypothetical protein